jgi:hypothetical protein
MFFHNNCYNVLIYNDLSITKNITKKVLFCNNVVVVGVSGLRKNVNYYEKRVFSFKKVVYYLE